MYAKLPNLVIAFHGCDEITCKKVLNDNEHIVASSNDYDWLGNGIYFWEQNLERAWQWANEKAADPKSNIKNPAVIGAVLNLGNCLNLSDSRSIGTLKTQYEIFKTEMKIANKEMPVNRNVKDNNDVLLRRLDCAVIESLHEERRHSGENEYDSVRGVFFEGESIYAGSEFKEKTHIQICIKNPNCIKGYFFPIKETAGFNIP